MKSIIALFLAFFAVNVFAGTDPLDLVGDRCAPGDVLFYAQTTNHKKEVLVCQWNTTVFYRFGKVGQKPDLDLKIPAKTVNSIIGDTQTESSESLLIKNGKIVYQVGHSEDLIAGKGLDYLTVIEYGKGTLAEIVLDSDTVINGIRDNFVKE